MIEKFIREFIKNHPHRLSGTQQELDAQKDFKHMLKAIGVETEIQHFSAPLNDWYGSLLPLSISAVFLLITSYFYRDISLFISIFISLMFVIHFILRINLLGFLFKNQKSSNLVGPINTEDEKVNVLLGAHIDSTYEFRWWYLMGHFGAQLNVIGGFFIILMPIIIIILHNQIYSIPLIFKFLLCAIVIFPIFTLATIHNKKIIINGATDDLSGISIIHKILNDLKAKDLKKIRIFPVIFGAEEPGRFGSEYFAKTIKGNKEKILLINIDGIINRKDLAVVESDALGFVTYKYPKTIVENFINFAKQKNVLFKQVKIINAGTDATNFAKKGITALNIIGSPHKKIDPCYHTRLDTVDRVDFKLCEEVSNTISDFILEMDEQ